MLEQQTTVTSAIISTGSITNIYEININYEIIIQSLSLS